MSSSRKTLMDLISSRKEEVSPSTSFLADLKSTVSSLNPPSRGSNYYKPSSMNCQRQMYFTRIEAPLDVAVSDYSGVRIPETGTASHERIQYYVSHMKDCNIDCEYVDVTEYVEEHNLDYLEITGKKEFETKLFDTRYKVSFLCDGIIKYKGVYYILEIKTETDMKGANRADCDPKHHAQVTCYSLALGIDKVMWIYEERNFCVPKCFMSIITDEEREKFANYLLETEEYVSKGEVPAGTSEVRYCTYCNFKTECKKYS